MFEIALEASEEPYARERDWKLYEYSYLPPYYERLSELSMKVRFPLTLLTFLLLLELNS